MQYAVIRLGGKQYKVSKDSTIEVDKIAGEAEEKIVIDDVLLVADGNKVTVGKPLVNGAKVTAKIVEQKKGDKIRVMKFKSKVRYRKTTGFRALLSVVKIEDILLGSEKKTEAKATSNTAK